MKKILLILACAVFCPDHAFSGLKEIATKYAPHCDINLGEENLKESINVSLGNLNGKDLYEALLLCVEEGGMQFVEEHMGRLVPDCFGLVRLFIYKMVEEDMFQTGRGNEAYSKDKDLHTDNVYIRDILCACVEKEENNLYFVEQYIGLLSRANFLRVLTTCVEIGKINFVEKFRETLGGWELEEILIRCLKKGIVSLDDEQMEYAENHIGELKGEQLRMLLEEYVHISGAIRKFAKNTDGCYEALNLLLKNLNLEHVMQNLGREKSYQNFNYAYKNLINPNGSERIEHNIGRLEEPDLFEVLKICVENSRIDLVARYIGRFDPKKQDYLRALVKESVKKSVTQSENKAVELKSLMEYFGNNPEVFKETLEVIKQGLQKLHDQEGL